ncbi:hypothetical protein SODG_006282 [Sodalis praecaptivus]
MTKTFMLDTNICSFIMRELPVGVITRLEQAVLRRQRVVVSAITYAEMRFGAVGKKPRRVMRCWLSRSASGWMRYWLGTGPRWMPLPTLKSRWRRPVLRSEITTRQLPATPLRPVPC